MKREHQDSGTSSGGGLTPPPPMKSKMTEEEEEEGVDELLAALGYKVRSSDMADVEQKLDMVMMMGGSSSSADDAILSNLIKQITVLAESQIGAMRKVAGYFAEALARRIYNIAPPNDPPAFSNILHMNFYESAPYLRFAHFTANQAILEAFSGRRRVHVVDLGMKQGTQWPALLQALALQPGGPPSFRLTAVSPDGCDAIGWKLARFAEEIGVEFEFRGLVGDSVADLDLELVEGEAVAVNAVFEMHRLLSRPGAAERAMRAVKAARPAIVTVVEQEASHNGGGFSDRFNEALHYYSTMFDSLEASADEEAAAMAEVYLGRQICDVVACEGEERRERHETLGQWRERFGRAGFEPIHLGSNAFKQASMLLALFAGGDGFSVEEREGCLTLGWHTRPLIATSAWRVAN